MFLLLFSSESPNQKTEKDLAFATHVHRRQTKGVEIASQSVFLTNIQGESVSCLVSRSIIICLLSIVMLALQGSVAQAIGFFVCELGAFPPVAIHQKIQS